MLKELVHHIMTLGHPEKSKSRRLAPENFGIARKEFQNTLSLGITGPSKGSWSSTLHMVPDDWEQRSFKRVTIPERYSISFVAAGIAGKTAFHSIKPVQAYNQIPNAGADNPKK